MNDEAQRTSAEMAAELAEDPLLTVAQVASRLRVSLQTVRRMVRDGRLPVMYVGKAIRVRTSALTHLTPKPAA